MADVRRFFHRPLSSNLPSDYHFKDYNAPPSSHLLVMCPRGWVESLRWGLPGIDSDIINARVETFLQKPTFSNMEKCLVIVSGFYEFNPSKVPFAFKGEAPVMCLAGLRSSTNVVIMTRPARPDTKAIHDRLPVVFLSEAEASRWLDSKQNFDIWRCQLQVETTVPTGLKCWQVDNKVKDSNYKELNCIQRLKMATENRKIDEYLMLRPSQNIHSLGRSGDSEPEKQPTTPSKRATGEVGPRETLMTGPHSDLARLSNAEAPPKPEEEGFDRDGLFHFLDEAGEELHPAPQSLADLRREEKRLAREDYLMLVSDYFSGRIEALRCKPNALS